MSRGMDSLFAALIVMLGVLPLHAAADVKQKLAALGFVPGVQPQTYCEGPVYKPEISSGRLSIRRADASALIQRRSERWSFAGKAFRFEVADHGEFGGELNVVAPGGKRGKLLSGNVQYLMPVGDDLYVFEGLDHLGMSTGSIHVVRAFDSAPKLQFLTLMTDTPIHATLTLRRHFLIVGNQALTEFEEEFGFLKVHPYDRVVLRAASSLVEQDGIVVIGTCDGVVSLELPCNRLMPGGNLEHCRPRFYVPKK